jgi:hypothetical protein
MKVIKLIALGIFTAVALNSCMGDHSANKGRDTEQNSYHVAADSSKIDTSKVTSPDNSGSGGTALVKDTSKMKKDSTKK